MSQETVADNQDYRVGVVRNIAFVAFPDVEMLDVCGPFDVFAFADRWSRKTGKASQSAYQLDVIAPQAGPLRTSSGLKIVADHAYQEFDHPIDTLIVAGGEEGLERACTDAALISWIKEAARARRVASVCSGALLLAATGLLNGRRATTHRAFSKGLASSYPSVCVEADQIYIRDGHIYTSGGVTAGIDLALALVEEDLGRNAVLLVARLSAYLGSEDYIQRHRREAQLEIPGHPSDDFSADALSYLDTKAHGRRDFRELQAWILAHPDADLSIEALAERVAMSPRNFARIFMTEAGMTPAKFVEQAPSRRHAASWSRRLSPSKRLPSAAGSVIPSACVGASVGCSGSVRRTTARALSLRYCTERLLMDGYSPVLCPGDRLQQETNMNRTTANTLSELRSEWASWMSLEICIVPSASRREGVPGQRSWPTECVGERFVREPNRTRRNVCPGMPIRSHGSGLDTVVRA
jgi:transcriptional regulator GlxA family with amidase domain